MYTKTALDVSLLLLGAHSVARIAQCSTYIINFVLFSGLFCIWSCVLLVSWKDKE